MWAPRGTPAAVATRMQGEIQKALASATVRAAWTRNGSPIPNLYGADFGKFVASEVDRWAKVVRDANVKLEQ
jgi:tripartite-type tricarboxylate transporter receptor subunit TctC